MRIYDFIEDLDLNEVGVEESENLLAFELSGGDGPEVVVDFEEVGDKEVVSTHPTISIIMYIIFESPKIIIFCRLPGMPEKMSGK